jgi:3-oxoacyl-[acyl-carrier protein] reductase
MSKRLDARVAVVTGSSKSIGASIVKALGADGAAVVVSYASSKQGAERVAGEISERGGRAIAVHGNVSKSANIGRLFSETRRSFGRLDILVTNAGVYEVSPLEAVTAEHFHKYFSSDEGAIPLVRGCSSRRSSDCRRSRFTTT